MTDGRSKDIINFPGGRWHSANQARRAHQAQSITRKGVTYANYLNSPGEIIQQADSSS